MWINITGLVLCFYICTRGVLGYLDTYSKWRERDIIKGHHRFSAVMTTTTPKPQRHYSVDSFKLRHNHQSRFPNLDRAMNKIDRMNSESESSVPYSNHHRARHSGRNYHSSTTTTTTTTTTDEGLFGNYFDYSDGNEGSNDYWEDEDGNIFEYDEDDLSYDDSYFEDEMQDEGTQDISTSTTTTTARPLHSRLSPLSEYKWERYGTRSRFEESRREELNVRSRNDDIDGVTAVIDHFMKVRKDGECKNPLPRVISIQSVHPDLRKTYTPHCTILHRCAEDTGCCSSYLHKCGPKTQREIELYFYIKTMGDPTTRVEKLSFVNHTECACLEKNKTPVTTIEDTPLIDEGRENHSGFKSESQTLESPINHSSNQECKCPEEFSPLYTYTSRCSCVCEDENSGCSLMKKGNEYLSLTDRKCILDGICGIPICEYGAYKRNTGRCPRKEEKFEEFANINIDD